MHEIVNKKFKGGAYRKIISSTGPVIRREGERERACQKILNSMNEDNLSLRTIYIFSHSRSIFF